MRAAELAPMVRVEIGGRPLSGDEAMTLAQVLVIQRPSAPSLCELTFVDPGPVSRGLSGSGPGLPLRVTVGDPGRNLFQGETTAVEFGYDEAQGRTVRVRGYDRLHHLRGRRPQRAHVEVALSDLARELTSDLNVILEGETTSPVWGRLIQSSESDLTLLRRISDRCGLHFALDGNVLRFFTPEGHSQPVSLQYGDNLLEASVEFNSVPNVPSVHCQGWDPWLAETREGVAQRPRVGRRLPGAVLDTPPGEPVHRTNGAFQQDDQARVTAQAELDRRAAKALVFKGVAQGDPALRPGVQVEVEGLDPQLCGSYALTSVTHCINADRGYRSEFSTQPPEPEPSGDHGPGLALGVVSQVADPAGLGRVKVELSSCGGMESDWLQTLAAGGGRGKGLVTVPDLGDRVAVLFVNGDLSQGVVLGGLYGSAGPPDAGVEGGRVKRLTLRSPTGHFLRFDDTVAAIRLENSEGSYVELGRERMVVHAECDLEIEAPGKTLVLRAAAVDFQRG